MALVKYREFDIPPESLDGSRSLQITIPVTWLRDHIQAGDRLALYIDSEKLDRLIIEKLSIPEKADA